MTREPRLSERQRLEALADKFEPGIRASFLSAIQDIVSRAEIGRIAVALERGDIDGAIRALHLDPAAFRGLEDAIRQAFIGGGDDAVAGLPVLRDPSGGRMVIRFDARNPRAEAGLRDHSSNLVTRIVEDQRTAIRAALREGMAEGANPRETALNVTGRVNRATGRREGGIVGLTAAQERFVSNARRELLGLDAAYFERERRDKRFDAAVRRSIADGKPLDTTTVNKIIGRYSDRLLKLRGETIARTETISALNRARLEAMEQAIESGSIRRQDVRKIWHTSNDERVRTSHRALDGDSVAFDAIFANGLRFPGDPRGPASEVVSCRCVMTLRVDFLANIT